MALSLVSQRVFNEMYDKYVKGKLDSDSWIAKGFALAPLLLIPLFIEDITKLISSIYKCYNSIYNIISSNFDNIINYEILSSLISYKIKNNDGKTEILYEINDKQSAILHYIDNNYNNIDGITSVTVEHSSEIEFSKIPELNKSYLINKPKGIWLKIIKLSNVNLNYKFILSKRYASLGYFNNNQRINALNTINDFIKECEDKYNESISNNFSNKHLIFDGKVKHKIIPTKCLGKNLFFEGMDEISEYIDRFRCDIDNTEIKKKYTDSGYPYKGCMLVHGKPGCGKTSLIKYILERTKRHGVLCNFGSLETNGDFDKLINPSSDKPPLNKSCLIFEDVSNFLNSKILFNDEYSKSDINDDIINGILNVKGKSEKGKLSLSHILNRLDGVCGLEGALIIFTSNHVYKFAESLIRPGRIDIVFEMKPAKFDIMKKMIKHYYKLNDDDLNKIENLNKLDGLEIEQCKIQQICFSKKSTSVAIDEILKAIENDRIKREADEEKEKNKKEEELKSKKDLLDKIKLVNEMKEKEVVYGRKLNKNGHELNKDDENCDEEDEDDEDN